MSLLRFLICLLLPAFCLAAGEIPPALPFVQACMEETLLCCDADLGRYLFTGGSENELRERHPDGTERNLVLPQLAAVQGAWYMGEAGLFLWGRDAAGAPRFLLLREGEEAAVDITPADASPFLAVAGSAHGKGGELVLYRRDDSATAPLYALPLQAGAEPYLFYSNTEQAIALACDRDGTPAASLRWESDGSKTLFDLRGGTPRAVLRAGAADLLQLLGCGCKRDSVYIITDAGREATALVLLNLASGAQRELVAAEREDVSVLLSYPDGTVAGACTLWETSHYHAVIEIPAWESMREQVRTQYGDAELQPLALAANGRRVCARVTGLDGRAMLLHYDYEKRRLCRLDKAPPLPAAARPVRFALYPAADGTEIPLYYCTPDGKGPFPTVVFVHGGPRMRTTADYDWRVQYLVHCGFAVAQPQFRGSRGWGRSFMHAGDRQWGLGVMQTDVNDCVPWLVEQGIAEAGRVAIFGGSYGGYAVTAGLCFTPELYACGISLMGPQNLPLMLAAYNGDTAAYAGEERLTVGDPDDPADAERLRAASPALHADNFRRPLFIYYGEKDTLVPPEHSRQLIRALRAAGKTVEVHTHPTEAHGFSSPANEADLYIRIVDFLRRSMR